MGGAGWCATEAEEEAPAELDRAADVLLGRAVDDGDSDGVTEVEAEDDAADGTLDEPLDEPLDEVLLDVLSMTGIEDPASATVVCAGFGVP